MKAAQLLACSVLSVCGWALASPLDPGFVHYRFIGDTDVHGLNVKVERTETPRVAVVHIENRAGEAVSCSVGFFYGTDLRRRAVRTLRPGEEWSAVYRVWERQVILRGDVVCDRPADSPAPKA